MMIHQVKLCSNYGKDTIKYKGISFKNAVWEDISLKQYKDFKKEGPEYKNYNNDIIIIQTRKNNMTIIAFLLLMVALLSASLSIILTIVRM